MAKLSSRASSSRPKYDTDRFFIGGNVAWSEGENKLTGESLNSVRPVNGLAYVGTRFFDNKLTLSAEMEFFGDKQEVGQNQQVVGDSSDGAVLFNVFGACQPNEDMSIEWRVNNVLDRQYRRFDQIDQGQGWNANLTMQLKW